MTTSKHPAMKPVLVQEVTDDVRALRGSDVEQQQKVLSARGVADCMAGDLITADHESDEKYFNDDGKIDMNIVVDAGCRYVDRGTYIHGPEYAVDPDDGDKPYAGFLYTLAVLPTGDLFWGDYQYRGSVNGGLSFEDPETQGTAKRLWNDTDKENTPVGTIIRQVFWTHNYNKSNPDDLSNTDAYTRIGKWTREPSTEYPDPHYEWGAWQLLSGEKLHIIVTDPSINEVQNPIVNAIYHVYTSISEFVLPEANAYRYGNSITIIQYPDPSEENRNLWSTYVRYDYVDTDASIDEHVDMLCTPCPNRNTARSATAYLDGLSPTTYEFEIVPLIDNDTKEVLCHTWEMCCVSEETEFTTGITEMLAAHTESGVNDIVDYLNRKYYEDSSVYSQRATNVLEINRSMTASGYVCGEIKRLTDNLAGNWSVTVKHIASDSESNFIKTVDTTPSSTKLYFVLSGSSYVPSTQFVPDTIYYRFDSSSRVYYPIEPITTAAKWTKAVAEYGTIYTRNGGCYQLAVDSSAPTLEPGYLSRFESGTTYYELDSSLEAETIFSITGADIQTGDARYFRKYMNRHDLIYVLIKPAPTQSHIAVRDGKCASVVVKIVPDPHPNSYLHPSTLNPSAYTQMQLLHLQNIGRLANNDGSSAETLPASTGAVIAAHNMLASKLQTKGLLFGSIDRGALSNADVDTIKATGMYRFSPSAVSGFPEGVTTDVCHLTVIDNVTAPSTLVSDDDQYKFTEDEEPAFIPTPDTVYKAGKYYFRKEGDEYIQIRSTPEGTEIPDRSSVYNNRVYYYFDNLTNQFTLAGTNGYVTAFEPIYEPYYERREGIEIGTSGNIIQTLYQFSTIPGIWTRMYVSGSWTEWVRQAVGEFAKAVSVDVTTSDIATFIKRGSPVVTNNSAAGTWNIALPAYNTVPAGTTLKFRRNGVRIASTATTNKIVITTSVGASTKTFSVGNESSTGSVVEVVATSTTDGWIMKATDCTKL